MFALAALRLGAASLTSPVRFSCVLIACGPAAVLTHKTLGHHLKGQTEAPPWPETHTHK